MANPNGNERYLQMMKMALPYLPDDTKQVLNTYITMTEVHHTLTRLEQEQEEILSSCSLGSDEPKETALFNAIKDLCTDREREMLDMVINVQQASKFFKEYNTSNGKDNMNKNPMDMMRMFLSPDQQAMIDTIQMMSDLKSNQ
ncbi:MAG: hypothetical protein ACLRZ7_02360 [Lachnospiraceae bacterium]